MASSIIQPKFPVHYYQPILHSRLPPALHLNPKTVDQHPQENPSHFADSPASRLMTSANSPLNSSAHAGSLQERLGKLEALLPIIHDIYGREISALRAEIESLKGVVNSKTVLNKNAPPFVPGPAPMTPTTPVDFKRPSSLMAGPSASPDLLAFSPPPGLNPHDLPSHHEQVQSLSQQVNVLSNTMSQLITTLLASPNGSSAAKISNPLLPPSSINPTCLPHGPSSTPSMPPYPMSSPPMTLSGKPNSLPGPARSVQRPGHLSFAQPLDSPLPQAIHTPDGAPSPQFGMCQSAAPRSNLRLRLLSPTVCRPPMSLSSPLSPLPQDNSATLNGAAPANSLAGKWENLGITGDILRAIVRFGVGPPSKTQQKSIPNMLLGKDLISQSNPIQERIQSYIIPALQLIMNEMTGTSSGPHGHLASSPSPNSSGVAKINTSVKVLVITATLDEASQAHRLARGIAALLPHPPKIEHCGSSEPMMDHAEPPNTAHHVQPHLLIGTPSKLLDSVNGLRGYTFDPHSFSCVILDEMDQLLARNLSDMVTSLMAFLPSNSPETSHSTQSVSPPKHDGEAGAFQPVTGESPGEWTSSRQLRQSPQNSVTSSTGSSDGKASVSGRQTCIFSCTVPQDVLTYARTLNVRVKLIVRREDSNNSASSNPSPGLTPLASCFDLGDPRTPHLATFPWTNQSGNGNSSNTHQLLRHLSQFYHRADAAASSSIRERKLRALIELLFDPEVASLRAGRGQLVIIYCNSVDSVESVSYALGQSNIDVLALYQDMGPAARHSLLAKFGKAARQNTGQPAPKSIKVLVVYDVLAKTLADMSKDQPSLVINYELPRAVEDYIHRAGCIISLMNGAQNKRVGAAINHDAALINLVNAPSEIETIKSIESFYRCKIQDLRAP